MDLTLLKRKTFKSISWRIFGLIINSIFTLVVSITLARLLQPKDFGQIAMAMVIVNVAGIFQYFGLGGAVIYRKDISQTDLSSIFYLNIAIGGSISLCVYGLSSYVAKYYGDPNLTWIIQILSFNFIISSLGNIHNTILTKSVDFKKITIVGLISTFISGSVGIIMAYSGYGVLSLVIKSLTNSIFLTVLLWFFGKWIPSFEFQISSIKKIFDYSVKTLAGHLINTVVKEIDNFLVGKYFRAEELGFYSRAKGLKNMPISIVSNAFSSVLFPVLSKMNESDELYRATFRKVVLIIAFIVFPIMVLFSFFSDEIIVILLTNKWINASKYLRLVCIIGMIEPLSQVCSNIFLSKGRPGLMLKVGTPLKILSLCLLLIGIYWGVLGLIWAMIVYNIVSYVIIFYYAGNIIQYSIKGHIGDILPFLIISVISGILSTTGKILFNDYIYRLIFGGTIFFLSYLALVRMFIPSVLELIKDFLIFKRRND